MEERYALSVKLALHYLKAEKIKDQLTKNGELQIGKIVFPRLRNNPGAYQTADTWGNQVILNYRSYRSPADIAETVTLTDILRDKVNLKAVKDKIILIGDIHSTSPRFQTPYTQEIPAVILQAQMVSQILNAVLNGRPLIRFLPLWGEVLWVWGWSFVAGVLAYRLPSRLHLGLAGGVGLGVVYGGCYYFLTLGYWIPLIPSLLAIVVTASCVIAYFTSRTQRVDASRF